MAAWLFSLLPTAARLAAADHVATLPLAAGLNSMISSEPMPVTLAVLLTVKVVELVNAER